MAEHPTQKHMSESVNPEYWMNLDPPEPPIWELIERYAKRNNDEYSAALLSIRARVESLEDDSNEHSASAHFVFEAIIRRLEALEADTKPTPNSSQIRTSLLTLVSEAVCAMADCGDTPSNWQPEARAAIYAVAEWLDTKGQHGCSLWLREEVQ